jgi:hypothetical protein
MWGKWHLGSDPENRSPVDFGFDEAVWCPRTADEVLWTTQSYFPKGTVTATPYAGNTKIPMEYSPIYARKKGEKHEVIAAYDTEFRAGFDRKITGWARHVTLAACDAIPGQRAQHVALAPARLFDALPQVGAFQQRRIAQTAPHRIQQIPVLTQRPQVPEDMADLMHASHVQQQTGRGRCSHAAEAQRTETSQRHTEKGDE